MNEDHTTKKVFNAQLMGTRRKGRPNLRRIDGPEKDLLVLRSRNWRTLEGRRLAWGKESVYSMSSVSRYNSASEDKP
ncbi:hypothetical protein TNCV_29901 [Trichonephila clavipes]|nr:hypothetical protein TNCV_29901 [Trichonephila clavipes]